MKPLLLIFMLFSLLACQKDQFVIYENLDSLSTKKSVVVDSLYNEKNGDIVHSKILIDSVEYYIVEGDLLLTNYEYNQYKLASLIDTIEVSADPKLVGEIRDNEIVKWPKEYTINYCINKNTFRTVEEYTMVKNNMREATLNWEQSCNVKFYHDEAKDSQNILTATAGLTFVVVGFNSNNRFIASAFFPYDPVTKRRVLIDPTYFTTSFDKIGVLRHELGHVLGFRHEHIRSNAPKICPDENTTGTFDITQYDPKSVMHYFCGGMGTIELIITDVDKEGSQEVYGPPIIN